MTIHDNDPTSHRFKDGCADLHATAESGDFARKMISGTLTREAYIRMLEQALVAMRPLDEAIRRRRSSVPALAALVDDSQFQAPNLEADLRYLGVDPGAIEPGPAARALAATVADVERRDPLLLLALHYVREGANNGNHYVAKKLRPALGLPERDGSRHLDPYGPAQRATWEAFKIRLDAHPFTPAQKDALVETARLMFRAIIAMHQEVDAPANASR
jgi:heme oxygenase